MYRFGLAERTEDGLSNKQKRDGPSMSSRTENAAPAQPEGRRPDDVIAFISPQRDRRHGQFHSTVRLIAEL